MPHKTSHFVSPHFTHKKLEPPFYKDVVDVFEDRMVNWLLVPAKKLLHIAHGSVPAVALATNYIEGIEIYLSGKDSKGRSKEFFRRGFKRIFPTFSGPAYMYDAIADALYDSLRCGFAHDGMFLYFSGVRKEVFTVTWPKKNGQFEPDGRLESAVINPVRYIEGIDAHFQEYLKELRTTEPSPVKERFLAAVELKWQLSKPAPLIAMTEEEFHMTGRGDR